MLLTSDAGERELLHSVGSPAERDFDRKPGAAFFEPFQERALDHATEQRGHRLRKQFRQTSRLLRQNWTCWRPSLAAKTETSKTGLHDQASRWIGVDYIMHQHRQAFVASTEAELAQLSRIPVLTG